MQEVIEKQIINLEKYDLKSIDNLPLHYFIVNSEIPKIDDSSSDSNIITKQSKQSKKAGRKRKRPLKDGEKIHDKDARDNILRKVQVHFLSFIKNYMNDLLNHLGYTYEFIDIDYNIKRVITKPSFESLKKKTIGEILCQKISPKFSTKNQENNIIIYNKIKENKDLKYFLSQTFMKLFKDVYLKNKRSIDENGLFFKLSEKVETYEDLLNKTKEYDNINEYQKKINDVVQNKYLNHFIIKSNK